MRARHGLRVLSVYEGFFSGGARIVHSDVVRGLAEGGQSHQVLSIHGEVHREATRQRMEDDHCYRALTAGGVGVTSLGRSAGLVDGSLAANVFSGPELAETARSMAAAEVILSLKEQPLALLNQAGLPRRPVVACLHRSDPENQGPALDELKAAIAEGKVVACVCCAESTRAAYEAAGVPGEVLHVIPNGVDLLRFRPDAAARLAFRASLGIPAAAPVVVFAARYAPMKNVPLFLRAARAWLSRESEAHVLMCGAGMTDENPALRADIETAFGADRHLADRMRLLGVRGDMETVYAAADVVALTSVSGEAAPLCLIEGMMCGAVPVTTDVGDSASIVEGLGRVTPPDPAAIAYAWSAAAAGRAELAPDLDAARERFSRTRMIAAYATLLDEVYASHVAGQRVVAQHAVGDAVAPPAVPEGDAPQYALAGEPRLLQGPLLGEVLGLGVGLDPHHGGVGEEVADEL
ncbi:glycosyltransferase involved in cell wall biosynthesis [Streptomyces puniciscabiei]|uniref:D-inositol 3-phosphate glycosyltransferase n=1 Tax=Streptomyces puniciscabiei TaxID=164348 RepID=A0A542UJC4_9ACTN|nr:glycosyltransferase involved in cell wall biosynthesis [Streptomyces puniciscabiei]